MNPFCALCGHEVVAEVKEFRKMFFDTRCHRKVISEIYDDFVRLMPYFVRRMFSTSGIERAGYRARLRQLIADYRALSY